MNTRFTARAAQRGFSITELAISAGLGLGVIASVLGGYLALSAGTVDALAAGKLDRDIAALANLMASELRHAGFSGADTAAASNPFAGLAVFDAATQRQASTGHGSCVLYAYDADGDGTVAASELAGFRLTEDGAVQMRTSGNPVNPDTCTSAGASWIALTDPDLVTITALDFDLAHSTCVNASEPDGIDDDGNGVVDDAAEADCLVHPPAAGSGDVSVERYAVLITLSARLARDTFVQRMQTRHVLVRNAFVRRH